MIRYFLIFGLFIFFQGCQTTDNYKNKAEPSQKSFIKNIKSVVKKPKYAPYDWKPSDANSREIWFEETYKRGSGLYGGYSDCEWFYRHKGQVKNTFLRNGNVIVEKDLDNSVSQIVDVSFEPQGKLIFIEGLDSLSPSSYVKYETKEGLEFIKVKFIYKYDGKED